MAYNNYLNKIIVVKRNKTNKNDAGYIEDESETLGTYLARLENLSSNSSKYLEQNSAEIFDKIYTTADCLAEALDVLELRDRTSNKLLGTYEVRRVETMETAQRVHHIEMDVNIHT